MKLTIDFETRSREPISNGAWKYAEHPTTEVLCLAVKVDDQPVKLWAPDWIRELLMYDTEIPWCSCEWIGEMVKNADEIEAHNVEFERAIWTHVMMPRYGVSVPLSLDKCRCSAAKAARLAIPRDLASACKVMGSPVEKDERGHRVVMKLCKPRAARKADKEDPHWESRIFWNEDPEDFRVLLHYCIRDVEAEYALSQKLPDLPAEELEIWKIDQECNERGVRIDLRAVDCILRFYEAHTKKLTKRLRTLTDGFVTTGSQIDRMLEWLRGRGVQLPSLAKDDVAEALKRPDLDGGSRQLLELRQSLAKTSTRKYGAMLKRVSADGYARSLLLYHGASTGRWTAKAIQIQNLPRGAFKDAAQCIDLLMDESNWDIVEEWWGDPTEVASSCLRGMLVPSLGRDLISADFSAIEGRVLAWLAGETRVLDAYRDGLEPYKVNASRTFRVVYAEVTKWQRQIGKVQELALGYQGGIGSFESMGRNYGIESSDLEGMLPELLKVSSMDMIIKSREWVVTWLKRNTGTKLSPDAALAADLAKIHWRNTRPATVRYWACLEEAAISAVRNPGTLHAVRGTVFGMKGDFLCCRLPSGRTLWYCQPSLRLTETPWGEQKATLHYWGVDAETHRWQRTHTYGGKLAENITQAVARDLMRDAIVRMDRSVYTLSFHVHDEIDVEVDEGKGDVQEFCRVMSETPVWAPGLPIEANGWRGKRYRKD